MGKAFFHSDPAADEAVALKLTISSVVNIRCLTALIAKKKTSRHLAVKGGGHMADNVGSVHYIIFFLKCLLKYTTFVFYCHCLLFASLGC